MVAPAFVRWRAPWVPSDPMPVSTAASAEAPKTRGGFPEQHVDGGTAEILGRPVVQPDDGFSAGRGHAHMPPAGRDEDRSGEDGITIPRLSRRNGEKGLQMLGEDGREHRGHMLHDQHGNRSRGPASDRAGPAPPREDLRWRIRSEGIAASPRRASKHAGADGAGRTDRAGAGDLAWPGLRLAERAQLLDEVAPEIGGRACRTGTFRLCQIIDGPQGEALQRDFGISLSVASR